MTDQTAPASAASDTASAASNPALAASSTALAASKTALAASARTQTPSATGPVDLGSHFAERVALYFGAVFLVFGVHLTYFPVWLASRGLTPEQIGLLTALPIILRAILTPIIGAYADATGRHRTLVVALSAASAVLAIAAWNAPSYGWLVVTVIPYSVIAVSVLPLIDTVAVAGVRAAGHDYGRMRLWGSLTFLIATLAAGAMIDIWGARAIIWALVGATIATAIAALMLPHPRRDAATGTAPLAATVTATTTRQQNAQREGTRSNAGAAGAVGALMTQPVFVLFIVAVGAIQASHAAFYTFGALHLQGQGVSGSAFGTLWAVAIIAEIVLLGWSAPFIAKLGAVRLLILGGVAAIVRWSVMSIDPPYAAVFALQILHGATYAATHLGAMHFIAKAVPEGASGTAQSLYSSVGSGLMTAAAVYLAGLAYPSMAGHTYLLMGAIAFAGTAAAITVQRSWDGRALV